MSYAICYGIHAILAVCRLNVEQWNSAVLSDIHCEKFEATVFLPRFCQYSMISSYHMYMICRRDVQDSRKKLPQAQQIYQYQLAVQNHGTLTDVTIPTDPNSRCLERTIPSCVWGQLHQSNGTHELYYFMLSMQYIDRKHMMLQEL